MVPPGHVRRNLTWEMRTVLKTQTPNNYNEESKHLTAHKSTGKQILKISILGGSNQPKRRKTRKVNTDTTQKNMCIIWIAEVPPIYLTSNPIPLCRTGAWCAGHGLDPENHEVILWFQNWAVSGP